MPRKMSETARENGRYRSFINHRTKRGFPPMPREEWDEGRKSGRILRGPMDRFAKLIEEDPVDHGLQGHPQAIIAKINAMVRR